MAVAHLAAEGVNLMQQPPGEDGLHNDEEAVAPGQNGKSPAGASNQQPLSSKSAFQQESWTQLKNLHQLYESGFITATEYQERKSQIVDTLTGTRSSVSSRYSKRTPFKDAGACTVVNKPPPDFSALPVENAIKFMFDVKQLKWSQKRVQIKMATEPFARGGLRKAYHMLDLDAAKEDAGITYVAKMAIDPYEDREIYFQDVEMQMYAREWAEKFNSHQPPKRIEFIQAWLIELIDRPGKPICGVERFIDGPYRKHNNNFGFVSDDERNTPQAFSHFTYEASRKMLLICDIQGVNDLYTDPQIHNRDGVGFGKGNMGERGFERFLSTHRCNHICRYLGLPSINAKVIDAGTRAPTTNVSCQVVNVHMPADPSIMLNSAINGYRASATFEQPLAAHGAASSAYCNTEQTPLVRPTTKHHHTDDGVPPPPPAECCCLLS